MDILLSVKSEYLKRIYDSNKSIEILKQIPRSLNPGDDVWFYDSEKGAVTGLGAYCGYIVIKPKDALEKYREEMGFTDTEFWNIVSDAAEIVLIGFKWVVYIDSGLPLSDFRLKRAPQSYCYVED